MKIVMSIREMAAMAGIVKQFDEIINPDQNKKGDSIQQMIAKMIDDFKEPEKHGFYSLKVDEHMNFIVDCEAEAVAKLIDIFKDFIITMYPLYKAVTESALKFSDRIQEVVDDYTEKESSSKEDELSVVVIHAKECNDKPKSSSTVFEKMEEDLKKPYVCLSCGRSARIRRPKNGLPPTCNNCGGTMSLN